jgi:hypothetical protein
MTSSRRGASAAGRSAGIAAVKLEAAARGQRRSLPAMPACCTASWLRSHPKQLDPEDGLVIFLLADA